MVTANLKKLLISWNIFSTLLLFTLLPSLNSLASARTLNSSNILDINRYLKIKKCKSYSFVNNIIEPSKVNQYELIVHHLERILNSSQLIEAKSLRMACQNNIEEFNSIQEEYTGINNKYDQRLLIAGPISKRQDEAATLGNIGIAYNSLAEYEEIINFHQQNIMISKALGDRKSEAISQEILGVAYSSLGEYEKAIKCYNSSLIINREIGDSLGESRSLGNLGTTYYFLGKYDESINFHRQDLIITTGIGNLQGQSRARGNLGIVYSAKQHYKEAIDYLTQALTIARKIRYHLGEANALGNLGILYYSQKQVNRAINLHLKALEINRNIGNRRGESTSLNNLGIAYDSLGKYNKAIDFYQQSLAIKNSIGNRLGSAISLNNLGAAYSALKQYMQAETYLNKAIKIYEDLRTDLSSSAQISIFETQAHTYRALQTIYMAQAKPHRALETAERGRTRTLIQLQAQFLPSESLAKLTQLPNVDQIRQIAQEQEATLVEYSLIDDQSLLIWVIQPDDEIIMHSVTLSQLGYTFKDLEEQIQTWINNARGIAYIDKGTTNILDNSQPIKNRYLVPPPPTKNPLRTLHLHLIQPIAHLLPSDPKERVIFIPHRSLFKVPFAALMDRQGNYLIHKHTILTAPSIQSLNFTRHHRTRVRNKATDILIVGNPTFSPELSKRFPNLPGTAKEAQIIAQILESPPPLIGQKATETAVKKRLHNAKFIHLATHSYLANIPSFNPGMIALSASKEDDGEFNTTELLELTKHKPLNAEMVVLSACETGRGYITGDGVVGLSRSLIAAGVPSVLVSLWDVEDAPTAALMEEFYRNFYQKKMNKAQALRIAMLAIIDRYPEPMNWASFTLIGEYR